MKLGITFEEKILKNHSLNKYIDFIIKNNINYIELAPDIDKYSLDFYKKIKKECIKNSIKMHFHLPHFANKNLDVTFFNKNTESYYKNFFNLCSNLSYHKNSKIIFHGSNYLKKNRPKALEKTQNFIEFATNYIENNNLNQKLVIETLNKNKHLTIGNNQNTLIQLCQKYENLNICWDITHYHLNNKNEIIRPKRDFLNYVTHSHIHGFNKSKEHLPLKNSKILLEYIKLYQLNTKNLTIELLDNPNYFDNLKNDIILLKNT